MDNFDIMMNDLREARLLMERAWRVNSAIDRVSLKSLVSSFDRFMSCRGLKI
jgi:hypothetical protein